LQDYLHDAPYTTEEIEEILQENLRTVMAKSPSSLAVLSAASNFKLFQVNSCFMSIITEDSWSNCFHYWSVVLFCLFVLFCFFLCGCVREDFRKSISFQHFLAVISSLMRMMGNWWCWISPHSFVPKIKKKINMEGTSFFITSYCHQTKRLLEHVVFDWNDATYREPNMCTQKQIGFIYFEQPLSQTSKNCWSF